MGQCMPDFQPSKGRYFLHRVCALYLQWNCDKHIYKTSALKSVASKNLSQCPETFPTLIKK